MDQDAFAMLDIELAAQVNATAQAVAERDEARARLADLERENAALRAERDRAWDTNEEIDLLHKCNQSRQERIAKLEAENAALVEANKRLALSSKAAREAFCALADAIAPGETTLGDGHDAWAIFTYAQLRAALGVPR